MLTPCTSARLCVSRRSSLATRNVTLAANRVPPRSTSSSWQQVSSTSDEQQPAQQICCPTFNVLAARRAIAAGLGSILGIALLVAPQPALAASSLAEVMRPTFGFVDTNKDGLVSQEELMAMQAEEAKELDVAEVPSDQVAFAMKLFDLNGDGKLSTDELLVSLALDRGVSEDAVDEGVYKAFDSNNDGAVDVREWTNALTDLGPSAKPAAEYVFHRVEQMTDTSGGKLDVDAFAAAYQQMRTVAMGY